MRGAKNSESTSLANAHASNGDGSISNQVPSPGVPD